MKDLAEDSCSPAQLWSPYDQLCPSYSLQPSFTSFAHLGLEVSPAQCQETSHELTHPFWCLLYKILNLSKKSLTVRGTDLHVRNEKREEKEDKYCSSSFACPWARLVHSAKGSWADSSVCDLVSVTHLPCIFVYWSWSGAKAGTFSEKKPNKLAKLSLYQVNKSWKAKYILASMEEPHFVSVWDWLSSYTKKGQPF